MKNQLILLFVLLSAGISLAQEGVKKIYSVPNLEQIVKGHKTIAILPFNVAIRYRRSPKNFDEQQNKAEEKSLSLNLQNNFNAVMSIKKDIFPINVQSNQITNFRLEEMKMLDNFETLKPEDVAKVLNVDAVMYCDYTYTRTNSEFGAILNEQLFGYGKVATGELTMSIFNGVDGELLWRFNKTMNQESLSYPRYIIERMLSKIGRNFPYQK